IYTIADIAADPHYRARGVIETVRAQSGIDVEMPGVVPKLSGTPGAVQASAPRLGQHTRDVLRSHGLTDAQIDALAAQGVIAEAAG
ncbi:CoA transferase, partial [Ralstonia sp. ASV6]